MRNALGFTYFLLTYLGVLFVGLCWGYPENVRHGYTNCTACHVSPNGGSLLTPYGRSLSAELMSTWGDEKAAQAAHGLVSFPEWFALGGDLRGAQLFDNRPSSSNYQFRAVPMQFDVEAGVLLEKWQATASFGFDPLSRSFVSRTHALIYHPTEKFYFRAGRFFAAYGLNQANHFYFIRQDVGFDQGNETYNAEASWVGDNVDMFVTLTLGRPENSALKKDQGIIVRSSFGLGETKKIGVSYFYGTEPTRGNRHLFGPFASVGISEKISLLSEIAVQSQSTPNGTNSLGLVSLIRLQYEMIKGLSALATHQFSELNSGTTKKLAYGLGLQWFPYPQFEIDSQFQWYFERPEPRVATRAWLLAHYYF